MSESSYLASEKPTEIRRNGLHQSATDCTDSVHVAAARGIWKRKTAEHWAAAAGVEIRAVKYWLSSGNVSAGGKLALARLMLT